jgi:hypothetical protein
MKKPFTLALMCLAIFATDLRAGEAITPLPAMEFEQDFVSLWGRKVTYRDLVGEWSLFSDGLKERATSGRLELLHGERVPFPVQEWDLNAGKNVWRQPALTPVEIRDQWKDFIQAWLAWPSGRLVKKTCTKKACTLTVEFKAGETASRPFTLAIDREGGKAEVASIDCSGPIRAVLKLVEKGEARWKTYAAALGLPMESTPSSEYTIRDTCYLAASPERQPTVLVKTGPVGAMDVLLITGGPWATVTVNYAAGKIADVSRTRVGMR